MKTFSKFIDEARFIITPSERAKKLGLVSDGKGGWYNPGTGEFEAKTDRNYPLGLKFFNKNHTTIIGKKDISSQGREHIIPNKSWVGNTGVAEELTQEELREKYHNCEIFNVGDIVENTKNGKVGEIIRRGTNHLICVTEDDEMFKSWITDVVEWTEVSGVPADQRLIGTDALRKYVERLTPGLAWNKHLINKHIKKSK